MLSTRQQEDFINYKSTTLNGFNYGDEITELKNKFLVECTKTANVSVIEMEKVVLFGEEDHLLYTRVHHSFIHTLV